jgi:hypothetical protein
MENLFAGLAGFAALCALAYLYMRIERVLVAKKAPSWSRALALVTLSVFFIVLVKVSGFSFASLSPTQWLLFHAVGLVLFSCITVYNILLIIEIAHQRTIRSHVKSAFILLTILGVSSGLAYGYAQGRLSNRESVDALVRPISLALICLSGASSFAIAFLRDKYR